MTLIKTVTVDELWKIPLIIRPDDNLSFESIRLQFLRWPRGQIYRSGMSANAVFIQPMRFLDGQFYAMEAAEAVRGLRDYRYMPGTDGLRMWGKEDVTRVRLELYR